MLSLVSSSNWPRVRLFLETLEVELVGASEDLPVQVAQVVARARIGGAPRRTPTEKPCSGLRVDAATYPRRSAAPKLQPFKPGQHLRI